MADSSLDIKMQDLKLSDSPVPALSPDTTPAETHTSVFETATPVLGPLESEVDLDNQEAEVEELLEYDNTSLKSADIQSDPILKDLARKQGRPATQSRMGARPSSAVFKARPAPDSTRQQGLGPRMTKSAALRQGLDWAAISSPVKASTASETSKTQYHVPGQKREDAKAPVASLAAPTIAPRATKASMLRTGVGSNREDGSSTPVKKDYAAQALVNKAREKEERERRRKSIALPASLSAPTIAPRQNRSSALRTGAPIAAPSRALASTTVANVEPSMAEAKDAKTGGLARRASMGVKSLGTPSIAPRLNKAALLRAPGSAMSSSSPKPAERPEHKPTPTTPGRGYSAQSSTASSKPSVNRPSSVISPRPTKASLLRAGLGAEVYSRKM